LNKIVEQKVFLSLDKLKVEPL